MYIPRRKRSKIPAVIIAVLLFQAPISPLVLRTATLQLPEILVQVTEEVPLADPEVIEELPVSTQPVIVEEAVIEEPELKLEPEVVVPTGYSWRGLELSQKDVDLMAKIVVLEAGGESFIGQRAVAEVILNRLAHPQFPNTIQRVLSQPGQFTTYAAIDRAHTTEQNYEAVYAALSDIYPVLDDNVVYFAQRAQNKYLYVRIGAHFFCYCDSKRGNGLQPKKPGEN
jgi:hypothetical protein